MTPRCDACAFWRISDDPSEASDIWDADDKQGTCRRNAPQPWNSNLVYELLRHLFAMVLTAKDVSLDAEEMAAEDVKRWEAAADAQGWSTWPGTTAADWCGEFRQREDAS